ncbi:MAG: LysM domain-containing protein, partial [Pseudomonadota bacterium]
NGAPFELVSYAGLEGARRAHALYTEAEAEALDGRCEENVSPSMTESMIDIAELCDVPLDLLVEYNPGVADISYSTSGATVQIPGGLKAPKGVSAMRDQLVQLDAVLPGDTLEKIAYRLDASEAAIANLNPGIDWKNPIAGQFFVTPAAGKPVASAASSSYAPPVQTPQWEGYSGAQGISQSGAASAIGDAALEPYELAPVKSYGRAAGSYPQATLTVDQEFVKAGGSVNVTASAAPGAEVTFYSGVAPGALTKSTTVRADDAGKATASIKVGKKSNMGGVIFGARAAGSDETQFSDRVGVVKLSEDAAPAEDDE